MKKYKNVMSPLFADTEQEEIMAKCASARKTSRLSWKVVKNPGKVIPVTPFANEEQRLFFDMYASNMKGNKSGDER